MSGDVVVKETLADGPVRATAAGDNFVAAGAGMEATLITAA